MRGYSSKDKVIAFHYVLRNESGEESKTAMAMRRWFIFMVVRETFYRRWKTLSSG